MLEWILLTIAGIVGAYFMGRRRFQSPTEGVETANDQIEQQADDLQGQSDKAEEAYDAAIEDAEKEAQKVVDDPPDDVAGELNDLVDDLR